jgi:hypothetical protein
LNTVTPDPDSAKVISFADARRRREERRAAARGRHPAGHLYPFLPLERKLGSQAPGSAR